MDKKMFFTVGVLLTIITIFSVFIGTKPKILNDWSSNKAAVLANKVWTIEFSKQIDEATVSKDSIFVTNEKGERQDITFSLENDRKTIKVFPPKGGYNLESRDFTLHVGESIKSTNGRVLKSGKEVLFVVQDKLPVVGSKQKLDEIFLSAIERQNKNRSGNFFTMDMAKTDSAEMASDTASNEGQSQNYSETNNQVQGVDEADTVKTDGTHIYQVVDGKVLITKALPANQMELEGTILYKSNFSPSQLFVYENQLVVIGLSYEEKIRPKNDTASTKDSLIWPGYFHSTKALVYDISNKGEPKQMREVEVEGSFVTSRRVGEHIYLISNHYPDIWMFEKEENVELRPRYYDSAISEKQQLVDYDEIQYFPSSNETNYTMIAAFNLNEPKREVTLTTYLGSGHQIYMSKENLYLAVTNYNYSAATEIQRERSYAPDTSVYKFTINEDKVTFHSSADVAGTILNQFSMDEYKGNFRVATTKGDTWNEERPSANNLYIFDENLKQLGELENLARGERIYSARFMQDRIYIVTFKQVDPLFVIDASNPTKPEVLGELKIPGFSNYLHPYDENHLIGIGHDTLVVPNKEGREPLVLTQGVKISLFDVSDVNNPNEKFTEVIGGRGTYTPLNYDHKALLYNKEKGLFAFPISIYQDVEGSEYEQKFEFQGAYVYKISLDKGFTLQSKITHMQGKNHYEEWEGGISRLVYIGDYLYALSPAKISSHEMNDFKLVGEVTY